MRKTALYLCNGIVTAEVKVCLFHWKDILIYQRNKGKTGYKMMAVVCTMILISGHPSYYL